METSRKAEDLRAKEDKDPLCIGSDPDKFWFRGRCGGCPYFSGESTIGSTPIDVAYAPYPPEPRIGYSIFLERCGKHGYNRETPTDIIKSDILKRMKSEM